MSSEARELTKAVLRGLVPLASGHYIVYDRHPDAPKGFGIRVSKTAKTFIVKVRHGARVVTNKHLEHVFKKLGVETRAAAAALASSGHWVADAEVETPTGTSSWPTRQRDPANSGLDEWK